MVLWNMVCNFYVDNDFPLRFGANVEGEKFNIYVRIGVSFVIAMSCMVNIFTLMFGEKDVKVVAKTPNAQITAKQQTDETSSQKTSPQNEKKIIDRPSNSNNQSSLNERITLKNKPGDIINGFKINSITVEPAGVTGLFGSKVIVTMENTNGRSYFGICVDIKGLDKDDIQVLSSTLTIMHVDVGQIFKFEQTLNNEKGVKSFEILKVWDSGAGKQE